MGSVVFKKFTGIDNINDPIRVLPKENAIGLSKAANVDIDNSFEIKRRDGFTRILTGNYRDVFKYEDNLLIMRDNNLVELSLSGGYAGIPLLNNLGPDKMNYCQVGEYIYFTNGSTIGYIRNSVAYTIPVPTVQFHLPMPAGHMLEYLNSILYVAKDDLLIYSDAAHPNRYDGRKNIMPFNGKITLLKKVVNGLYVGDSNGVYFLQGPHPEKFIKKMVANYPAIIYTASNIPSIPVGDAILNNPIMWASIRGICVGGEDGSFFNMTENNYRLNQNIKKGVSGCIDRNGLRQYMCSVQ